MCSSDLSVVDGEWLAGVHVGDAPGAAFDVDAHRRGISTVQAAGATPILFPCFGLSSVAEDDIVAAHEAMLVDCDRAYGFELGSMFHPAGRIYELATFEGLLGVPQLVGLKHSSLQRGPEWARIERRDATRPDFRLLTGNDLAIDMVMWGSEIGRAHV